MTAITPLELIHKKGIFGDHHKKNESDLINISEVKNLEIIQVVQYKRSKKNISEIKIDNIEFPKQHSTVTSNKETRILWNAPRTWLILSTKENINSILEKNCDKLNFSITNISHSRAIIQIKGLLAKEVLKKGSPINFNELGTNQCVGTVYNGIAIIIDSVSSVCFSAQENWRAGIGI